MKRSVEIIDDYQMRVKLSRFTEVIYQIQDPCDENKQGTWFCETCVEFRPNNISAAGCKNSGHQLWWCCNAHEYQVMEKVES
jgi:hypothetical protein